MEVYQVSFDLRNQRNVLALIGRIKTYRHVNPIKDTWLILITAHQTADQIRDFLFKDLDSGDSLLVTRLQGDAAWAGLSEFSDSINFEVTI